MSDPHPIIVLTRAEAGAHLTSAAAGGVTCVVSIGDRGEEIPPGFGAVPHRLRLEFADVEWEGSPERARPEDIQRLVVFGGTVRTAGGTTVVHCRAGIGRSPAAAYILYAVLFGPGREAEALEVVMEQRPFAHPNRWMVRLADGEMRRGGRLIGELDARFER